MTSGDQWITYEDIDSAILKAQYAKGEQLAGVFIWSVDTDGNECNLFAYFQSISFRILGFLL